MGSFVKDLWMQELNSASSLRSLHHLKNKHLFPTKYQQMNVALSVQFFSVKTAAALEKAVKLKCLPEIALTTAWWIKFICQWFALMTARHRKKSITKNNRHKKISFLNDVISVFKTLRISGGWKPLNTGVILSTTVIIQLSENCLDRGYDFFLTGRTTQDALENVFSQIRRKAGSKPTALQSSKALKMICVSQYLSDIKTSNYSNDTDRHLLTFSKMKYNKISNSQGQESLLKMPLNWEQLKISTSEQNDIYYIAGAAVNTLKTRKLCDTCQKENKSGYDTPFRHWNSWVKIFSVDDISNKLVATSERAIYQRLNLQKDKEKSFFNMYHVLQRAMER
ncbi:hypothetical protein JTE90_004222, partial [Oedothorax gibbosus]